MAARKFLVPIDLNQLELRQPVGHLLASAPGSPTEGQWYYNTTSHTLQVWNGTAWDVFGTLDQISAPAADVSLNSHKITSLATPTASGDAATRGYVLGLTPNDLTALAADYSVNSHKITSLSTPTASGDAATKGYVDGLISGVSSWKSAVRAATTANGTLSTAFVNGAVIDGVTLVTGDRILLKNQTAGAENGIRIVGAGTPARATDADVGSELLGAAVWVEEGTTLADTGWVQTVDGTITIDTTALTFVQFSGLGQVTAGAGLTKTANTLDVGAGTGISVAADSVAVDTAVVVRKYASDVGDGSSTSIAVTHSLGTLDVIAQVYVKGTGGVLVDCDMVHTDTNTLTLVFAVAPTSAQYRVTVHA